MMSAFAGYEKSYESFCFRKHIKESISINKERRLFYANLTEGASDKIFNVIIGYEHLTLIPAAYFDLMAFKYQKQGLDLFCHEFMSLNRSPDFDPNTRINPKVAIKNYDWEFYKTAISIAIKDKDASKVRKAALDALVELKSQPDYYCFSRHFFESIYRFAYFIPKRSQQAQELGLKDPTKLILSMIKLHLLGLKDAHRIDLLSGPIQLSGIPILCSEVPDLLFDLDHPELETLKHK